MDRSTIPNPVILLRECDMSNEIQNSVSPKNQLKYGASASIVRGGMHEIIDLFFTAGLVTFLILNSRL